MSGLKIKAFCLLQKKAYFIAFFQSLLFSILLAANAMSAQETVLFKLETNAGVQNNPPNKTVFTLSKASHISKIFTYHWNSGNGDAPGTISLKNTGTGEVIGTWTATSSGPPYYYPTVLPDVDVAAGTYEIVDSKTSTWSYNSETGNMGIAWVYGWETATAVSTLAAPLNFTYTLSNNQLTLSWNAVSGATGYKLVFGTASGSYLGDSDAGNVTQLGPIDITGASGVYYLAVKAYNSSQSSGYSNELIITLTQTSNALQAPQNLAYTLSNNQLTLSWNAVTGATGYKVGIGTQAGSYSLDYAAGNVVTMGPIDVTNVTGTYYLAAKAYNSSQESSYSNAIVVNIGSSSTGNPARSIGQFDSKLFADSLFMGKISIMKLPLLTFPGLFLASNNPENLINGLINVLPNVVKKITDGVNLDFGSGFYFPLVGRLDGSLSMTYSNKVTSTNGSTMNYAISFTKFFHNFNYVADGSVSGNLSLDQNSNVSMTLGGTIHSSTGDVNLSGNLEYIKADNCNGYPSAGSINFVSASKNENISFNKTCNGTYDYNTY